MQDVRVRRTPPRRSVRVHRYRVASFTHNQDLPNSCPGFVLQIWAQILSKIKVVHGVLVLAPSIKIELGQGCKDGEVAWPIALDLFFIIYIILHNIVMQLNGWTV